MTDYLIIFVISLLFSACGFYMYIYFFSVGYGFSIAAIGAGLLILFNRSVTGGTGLQCVLFMLYGLRLGGYLLIRELKMPSYSRILSPEMQRSRQIKAGPKIAMWISCAILYMLETSPVFFRLRNGGRTDIAVILGLIVMVCGLGLETAADHQKTVAKKKDPYLFVDTGLYRLVRCPNYLGEMIFWTGVLISGIGSLHGPLQWSAAVAGYVLIIYVMFSGARRLEIRQDNSYGEIRKYRIYKETVPILIPFVPLYSVRKYRFLAA